MNKIEFEEELMKENLYLIYCNGTEKKYNPNLFITTKVEKNSFGCLHIKDKWYCYVTGADGSIRCEKNFKSEDDAYNHLMNYVKSKASKYKNSAENKEKKKIMNKLGCTEMQARMLYFKRNNSE